MSKQTDKLLDMLHLGERIGILIGLTSKQNNGLLLLGLAELTRQVQATLRRLDIAAKRRVQQAMSSLCQALDQRRGQEMLTQEHLATVYVAAHSLSAAVKEEIVKLQEV